MLQAINQEGKLINLAIHTREEVIKRKKNDCFYCPDCKEQLVIKIGSKVIPHFAHHVRTTCISAKGGEGEYHEQGKVDLYRWLVEQGYSVELEAYLPEIKQRTDIFLRINNKRIAIEYQCARISEQEFLQRNAGYKKIDVIPLWILGGNRLNRLSKDSLSVTNFDLLFLHQFSSTSPLSLYYFCPNTKQITIASHIQSTGRKRSYAQLTHQKLTSTSFTALFRKEERNEHSYWKFWLKQMQGLRTKPNVHPSKQETRWREWLYQKQLHQSILPSISCLPVVGQIHIKSPPWIWQSTLCIELLDPMPIGKSIPLEKCKTYIHHHLLPSSNFPLINSQHHPVKQYFNLLVQLGYFTYLKENSYIKTKEIEIPTNVDAALKLDRLLIKQLNTQTISSN